MISTKDLSGLPNAERLKNFCKGLAALDIIMVEEEWSFIRHYTYNPAWRKGKEAFFATDGSDQSMIVMFAPEGCVINGVDSELYDWEEKLPRIEDLTDGMPPALQKCALPGFVDSKNEEKTERNAGYLVVSHSGGGMLRQGTRKGIRRTPANRGMRAHRIVKSLDISEDVCHGLCP